MGVSGMEERLRSAWAGKRELRVDQAVGRRGVSTADAVDSSNVASSFRYGSPIRLLGKGLLMNDQRQTFRKKWPVWRILAVVGFVVVSVHFHLTYGRGWLTIALPALIAAAMLVELIRDWRRLPHSDDGRSEPPAS